MLKVRLFQVMTRGERDYQRHTLRDRRSSTAACLSLLGDENKVIEIVVYGEEKMLRTGPTRVAKTEQKSLIPARQAQRTNQFVPFESPIASVSTVGRGDPFLASLITVPF